MAGLLARRYGERFVWGGALLGKAFVPLTLAIHPDLRVIPTLAVWQGLTGVLMWIAGVPLVQMVALHRKRLSNGLMMAALGIDSVLGPVIGRVLLYRRELGRLVDQARWRDVSRQLLVF